ncbi:MAG TPA: SDR family NAD(P)-dependent oxidoreductase [Devosiaceae bacterium]
MAANDLSVVVTGATAGLGEAIARRFVSEGARVVATGRRADRLNALAAELGPERCLPLALDVRDRRAVLEAFDNLPAPFSAPDVVVANAGLALGLEPAHAVDLDDWDTMVDTNIKGLLYTVRSLLPGMVERRRGHVLTIGSVAGDYVYPGGNVYGASKAFVKQFALGLRADLKKTGVRVTNIEPGMTETEFSLVRFKGDHETAQSKYRGTVSLTADDIAETVFWAATLPPHVNINRLQVMPVSQSFNGLSTDRSE